MSEKVKHERDEPELRFPEFEGEWEKIKLLNLFSIKNGFAFSSFDFRNHGVPLVKIANVGFNKMQEKNLSYLPSDFAFKYKDFLLKKGDYVVALTRPILKGQLKISQVDANFNNSLLNQRVGKLKSKNNLDFVSSILQLPMLIFKIEHHIDGTDPPNLAPSSIKSIFVNAPPLPEQEKIASFLSAVDEKIAQLEEKKNLLEDYKKGCMQQLFSQALRFKDEDGNDYLDWEEKRLGDVLTVGSGRDYKHLKNGDIPVYGTGGFMTSVDEYLYNGESVCIGRKGTIDNPMLLSGKFWTVDTLFYTHKFEQVLPQFIYAIFQRINWKRHNEASGVPSLSKTTIEGIKVSLPHPDEQQKIADFLSALDDKITHATEQLEQIKSFKKGLLQKMFV